MTMFSQGYRAALLLMCTGAAAAAPAEQAVSWNRYVEAFETYRRETDTVGGGTLLIKEGRIVARHNAGMADLERKQPVDDRTLFHYASITKTITAITLMQLHERGLVNLHDPVTKYLPELRQLNNPFGPIEQVTLRTLLDHSSGLQGPTWPWKKGESWEPFEPTIWEQLVAMLPYQRLEFQPGSKYSYSNPSFIYMARVIEQITGDPWQSYVQKNVFTPLGMTESYFNTTPYHLAEHRSNNYTVRRDAQGKPQVTANGREFNPGITIPNGGWNGPLLDVARYIAFLTRKTNGDPEVARRYDAVLKHSALEEMWKPRHPVTPVTNGVEHMGLTFFILPRDANTFVGHTGGQAGFRSFMYINPANGNGIVAAFNTADESQGREKFYALREVALTVIR